VSSPPESSRPASPEWAHRLAERYFKLKGWKGSGELPDSPKGVLIAAPHSSNWDLPYMLSVAGIFRLRINWLGKQSLFDGPGGPLMRALGGIPVDRSKSNGLVQQVVDRFNQEDAMYLAVAPSGTRHGHTKWKSGFYHIAREAGVPIVCGFLDYARKIGGVGPSIIPSGNIKADMDQIREFYADITGYNGKRTEGVRLAEEDTE